MGNIDPTNPLAFGTPEEVYEQSKRAIETAGKKGRFFLSGGCMISEEVSALNIEALIRAGYETAF
jgi:uroporphyrinogen-III decarboxylase